MSLVELVPVIVVLVIVGTVLWVYADARTRAKENNPVVSSVGSVHLDTPEAWAVACLILWIICLPLYAVSRNHPS